MNLLSLYLSAIRQKVPWGHLLASNDGKKPQAPWRKDNGVANRHDLRGLRVFMKKTIMLNFLHLMGLSFII